ncbi:ATP-binding protein, partial [Myxococcota bacterium]|nr:ATP-binding protein [Myxococcota bacterium]
MSDPRLGFFGRDEELSQLRALLTAARGGVGRAALVIGPSGVGKKRLVAALYPEILPEEILLEGWCHAQDPRPHGPLIALLGEAARQLSARGDEVEEITLALDLAAGLFDASADHLHFQEALLSAFRALSTAPVITLIHDAHLADPALLGLFELLLTNLFPDPVFHWAAAAPTRGLFIFTLEPQPHVEGLLEAARASTAVARVEAGGLEGEALSALLCAPPVHARINAITGGAPAALAHLLALLPRDMDELWRWRFGRLGAAARRLLDLLALIGAPCDVHRLSQLYEGEDLKALLGQLVEGGVLSRAVEAGRVHFFFSDHLIHQACLSRIAPSRAVALHRHLATRLKGLANVSPVRLADHALAGGLAWEAEVNEAATLLASNMAFEAAARRLERLIELQARPSVEARQRLASLYVRSGQPDAARRVLMALNDAGAAAAGGA